MRFVPDLIKNEPKNIAIIVFNKTSGECSYRFPIEKVKEKIGNDAFNDINKIIGLYLDNLPQSEETFIKWCASGGCLQLNGPLVFVTDDIEKELDYLVKTFI